MWITALIDACLLVNLALTVLTFLLVTEPERVVDWARRRRGGPEAWFDDGAAGADAVEVARLWARWMWGAVVAWGLITGFLIGLYWQGWFWRF